MRRMGAVGAVLVTCGMAWAQTPAPPGPPPGPSAATSPPPAGASAGKSGTSPAPTKGGKASPTPAAGAKASPTGTSSPPAASPSAASSATPVAPAATPAPPIIVNVNTPPAAPAPEPTSNSWAPGLLGLVILGTLGFFGWRYAKQRGLTVAGSLKQIGVEMPQDGVSGAGQVQPLRPTPPSQPPLPSLSELPAATSAPVGTAFGVSASAYAGPPRLVAVTGPLVGERFEVGGGLTVGRDVENGLPLSHDTTVSRRHARIEPSPSGGYQVTDTGSSNGTFVNGTRITGPHPVTPGDQIQIGATRLRFEA